MKENKNLNKSNSDTGNIRHLKMPERLWKLVSKASKNSRSVNDYIITLIENDLIKRKMIKKSERKKNLSRMLNFKNWFFRLTIIFIESSIIVFIK